MLRMNGMTRNDVEIVEFPYPDDWYDVPEMMGPEMENPSELWLRRDHKHDLAFRPLETALGNGVIDAMYNQSGPLQQLSEATGEFKAIEDLSKYPDWTLQVANIPAAITCTVEMAEKHPELAVTFLKGMIKVGRWANEHKPAAAAILDKQTFYLDVEKTLEGIKPIDLVPNLSPQNLRSVEIGKEFMLSHAYIKNDFDVNEWAAPEFLEQAARELLEEEWAKRTRAKLPQTADPLQGAGELAKRSWQLKHFNTLLFKKTLNHIVIMKKYLLIIAVIFMASFAHAQSNAEEVDLIQAAFGMAKKDIVSAFVQPSATQSDAFWDLYDAYETQRKVLGKQRIVLLEQYAEQYESLTSEQADEWTTKALALQKETDKLIATYYKKVKVATDGLVATQFYQVESYILTGIRMELLDGIPFVQK